MAWWTLTQTDAEAAAAASASDAALRMEQWRDALEAGRLPGFVRDRLREAGARRTPWLATMSPAELLLARSHGIRPVATVSGTCWYHFGYSWTNGHAEGWHAALDRLKQEAVAAGANAIVDVKLRTIRIGESTSMDYTVVGTAVTIDGLPPSTDPVVATVPAIEFVRLLEAGIVTTGIAIGAHYDWLTAGPSTFTGGTIGMNRECGELTRFWEGIRRLALRDLRTDTGRLGNGVLAHTHFGQLLRYEGAENQPARVLGRHIVIGTAVQCTPGAPMPHEITPVVDMADERSPLNGARPHGHDAYPVDDEGGSI